MVRPGTTSLFRVFDTKEDGMMKKTIGLTDFCLFQSPCDIQSQGDDLYFLLKQPDLAGNR